MNRLQESQLFPGPTPDKLHVVSLHEVSPTQASLLERRAAVFANHYGKSVEEYIAEKRQQDASYTGAYLLDRLYEVVGTEGDEHCYQELVHYRTDDLSDALAEYVRLWPKADNILVLNPERDCHEPMGEQQIHQYLDFLGCCGNCVR